MKIKYYRDDWMKETGTTPIYYKVINDMRIYKCDYYRRWWVLTYQYTAHQLVTLDDMTPITKEDLFIDML